MNVGTQHGSRELVSNLCGTSRDIGRVAQDVGGVSTRTASRSSGKSFAYHGAGCRDGDRHSNPAQKNANPLVLRRRWRSFLLVSLRLCLGLRRSFADLVFAPLRFLPNQSFALLHFGPVCAICFLDRGFLPSLVDAFNQCGLRGCWAIAGKARFRFYRIRAVCGIRRRHEGNHRAYQQRSKASSGHCALRRVLTMEHHGVRKPKMSVSAECRVGNVCGRLRRSETLEPRWCNMPLSSWVRTWRYRRRVSLHTSRSCAR